MKFEKKKELKLKRTLEELARNMIGPPCGSEGHGTPPLVYQLKFFLADCIMVYGRPWYPDCIIMPFCHVAHVSGKQDEPLREVEEQGEI